MENKKTRPCLSSAITHASQFDALQHPPLALRAISIHHRITHTRRLVPAVSARATRSRALRGIALPESTTAARTAAAHSAQIKRCTTLLFSSLVPEVSYLFPFLIDGVNRREVQAEVVVANLDELVERDRALLVRGNRELDARSLVNLLRAAEEAEDARVLLLTVRRNLEGGDRIRKLVEGRVHRERLVRDDLRRERRRPLAHRAEGLLDGATLVLLTDRLELLHDRRPVL